MTQFNSILGLVLVSLLFWSCQETTNHNFTVKGQIKGLKKGVVYLQKDGDSSIVNLDSMVIKGQSEFKLGTTIEEPIILYLKLFKNDGEEHYIPFFADKGETTINSTVDGFSFEADITGSKQQALLEEYLDMMSNFNNANLDLIKAQFLAQKDQDSIKIDSLQNQSDRLLKRKYAYTINFALNHGDSEVAPYLALYEIPNSNVIYVDSIYKTLEAPIKDSFYGKKLKSAIDNTTAD